MFNFIWDLFVMLLMVVAFFIVAIVGIPLLLVMGLGGFFFLIS